MKSDLQMKLPDLFYFILFIFEKKSQPSRVLFLFFHFLHFTQ